MIQNGTEVDVVKMKLSSQPTIGIEFMMFIAL
jgi:hypothetical protein